MNHFDSILLAHKNVRWVDGQLQLEPNIWACFLKIGALTAVEVRAQTFSRRAGYENPARLELQADLD